MHNKEDVNVLSDYKPEMQLLYRGFVGLSIQSDLPAKPIRHRAMCFEVYSIFLPMSVKPVHISKNYSLIEMVGRLLAIP